MTCIPKSMRDEVIIYLLCQIANGGGGGGSCTFQEGAGSPVGSVTPAFVGQIYHQTSPDSYWRSTGLTAADWTQITGGGASRGGGTFGLFSHGDSGATGSIVINDTTCIPGYDIENEPNITSLSFPNLVSIDPLNSQGGNFYCVSNPALTTLDVPLLATVGFRFYCESNPALTTLDVSSWVPTDGTTITFNGDALNATSVELVLRRCVLAGVTTCTIDLSGGTNSGLASLSAQGQLDAATLGAQLTINP